MIRDRNIDWRRKKVYYPAAAWADKVTSVGVGTGGPVESEINSLNITAMNAAAANDEFINHLAIPYDLDPDSEVGFRIHWLTGSTTDADDFVFTFLLDVKANEAAVVKPVTALDTVIADIVLGTVAPWAHQWSGRGIKDAGFLTRAQVEDGLAWMGWEAKITTMDADEGTWVLGVLMDYKVRATN